MYTSSSQSSVSSGIGFGAAIAITISWSLNKSVLWAALPSWMQIQIDPWYYKKHIP